MKFLNIKIRNLILISVVAVFVSSPVWLNHILAASNNFSGAIYTSTFDGTIVNQNRYDDKMLVYLDGGPQNQNGSGIPDGTYYFQVTDPSGATLLSSDNAVCRQLTVAGGVVSGAAGSCPHPNGLFNPNNGSTSVQLSPFDDTPNNGGEYKVWLIRQTSQTSIDANNPKVINFQSKDAKTDNFKVGAAPPPPTPCDGECPTVTLSGHKFYDANANTIDNGEAPVQGVIILIEYTYNDVTTIVTRATDASGNWSLTGVPVGATYEVSEALPCVDDDNDLLCDAPVKYWVQTAPVPDSNNFQGYSGTANANVNGLNFGNLCFGPASGGKTLGYWSNKNGQATMTTGMVDTTTYPIANPGPDGGGMNNNLAFLSRLNLKNSALEKKTGNTLNFDPANYNDFRTWLLNGNAVNMAYMLSVQLAATSLDVRHKYFTDSQIVDATSLGLGYVSIGSVRMNANSELNYINPNDPTITGANTYTGNPLRADEEILKDFLDGVNNNRLAFGSLTPCSVFYPPTQ